MAELLDKYFNVRIKLRNDSWTNWKTKENTFRPYSGEVIIYDIPNELETADPNIPDVPFQMIKIGNGIDYLKDLHFINDLTSYIKIGEDLGSISVLGKDIYIKGLNPEERDNYMAFKLISDYYTKIEIDSIISEEEAARKEADKAINERIDAEIKERTEQDKILSEQIKSEEQSRIEEDNNIKESLNVFKEEVDKDLEELSNNSAVSLISDSQTLTYTIYQGKNNIGSIIIPKDLFVENGSVVVDPEGLEKGTYIKLILRNSSEPIFINVGTLVDLYSGSDGTQINIEVDNISRKISATIVNDSITIDKLSKEIKQTLQTVEDQLSGSGEGSVDERINLAMEAAKKYTDEQIAENYPTFEDGDLSKIAFTGNVNDLVQTEGDSLIFDCN